MAIKRVLIIVGILLGVIVLGACVRSASTPPASVVTPPEEEMPVESLEGAQPEASPGVEVKAPEGQPTAANEVLQQLELFVSQTAAAAQLSTGQAGGEVVQGTPPAPESTEVAAGAQPPAATEPAAGEQPVAPAPATEQPGVEPPAGGQPTEPSQPIAPQPGEPQPTAPQPVAPQPTASQPAPIVVPSPTPGIPKTYILQAGEFPYCIARRFNVNPFELLSINGLSTSSVVRGGAKLTIPQTGNPFPGQRSLKAHPTTYVVQGGENIYEIACAFGDVSPDMIAYANGLQSPYTLTSGMTLNIP